MTPLHDELEKIFPDFPADVIDLIAEHEDIIEYPEGHVLCKQGAIENSAFVILDGKIDIFQHEAGQIHFIDSVKSGFIGEFALLLDNPRTADMIAGAPTRALEISREDFERYGKANPQLFIELNKLIIKRFLHQIDNLLIELGRHNKKTSAAPDFFISYSRKDEAFVRELASDLRRRGLSVWLDVHDILPGESWSKQIGHALDDCQFMILVMSPSSMQSENVDDEWNYYLDNKKVVIPILLEECKIPFRLHKIQYVNFVNVPYEEGLRNLVAHLKTQEVPERE